MRTTFFKNAIRYGSLSAPLLFVFSRVELPIAVVTHCVVGAAIILIAILLRQPLDLEKLAVAPDAFISQHWLRRQIIFGYSVFVASAAAILFLGREGPVDRWLMAGLLISGLLVTCLPSLAMNASDAS